MSYNWNWKEDKMGYAVTYDEDTLTLYSGNGLFIALHETAEEYDVCTFAADKEHCKTCIKDGCYDHIKRLWLDVNNRNSRKLAELFVKFAPEIEIKLVNGLTF